MYGKWWLKLWDNDLGFDPTIKHNPYFWNIDIRLERIVNVELDFNPFTLFSFKMGMKAIIYTQWTLMESCWPNPNLSTINKKVFLYKLYNKINTYK
jgi:hypothetical protein